jgi:hypothetical protein
VVAELPAHEHDFALAANFRETDRAVEVNGALILGVREDGDAVQPERVEAEAQERHQRVSAKTAVLVGERADADADLGVPVCAVDLLDAAVADVAVVLGYMDLEAVGGTGGAIRLIG